jgi:hypothetical protein
MTYRNHLAEVLARTDQAQADLDRLARRPVDIRTRRRIKHVGSMLRRTQVEVEGKLRGDGR